MTQCFHQRTEVVFPELYLLLCEKRKHLARESRHAVATARVENVETKTLVWGYIEVSYGLAPCNLDTFALSN